MFVDGDWVKAKGTTLGADNGLGVAAIMAILSSTNISHPNIEALFTIDEETGMTGAMGLEGGILQGEILLNLEDKLIIGFLKKNLFSEHRPYTRTLNLKEDS